jgi:cob(I)alamin adenosyltransferase
MKLYTKTGDDGTTGLFGADRVLKDDVRVQAYGCIDELNASLGVARRACQVPATKRLDVMLESLQSTCFDCGADLATPHGSAHEGKVNRLRAPAVTELEEWIDELEAENTPLTAFILPGGSDLAASLHMARAIGRRAERRVVTLSRQQEINGVIVQILNRMGDLLFAMARAANRVEGHEETVWSSKSQEEQK